MVTHNYPGMYMQLFVVNAIIEGIYYNVFITLSGKYIYPCNDLESKEIGGMLVFDDIAVGHKA
jgi:hypothetical protein